MAHIKLSLPVLEGFGGGDIFIVGDPSTEWGKQTAYQLGGQYLGGSIGAAVNAAVTSKGTLILVGPGTYTLTSTNLLQITKHNIYIKAAYVNPVSPTVVITSSLADTVEVDADNITFEGIEFKAGADACTNLIDVSDTVASSGLTVKNCVFNPNGKATVKAINLADATYAASRILVEQCTFLTGFDTAAINVGVLGIPNGVIRRNAFQITNAKVAIALADTTAVATGYGFRIYENDFLGADATADEVGISIAGTEDITGIGLIRNNYFAYTAAAAITIDKISKSEINNYYGDATTGGVIVNPGT